MAFRYAARRVVTAPACGVQRWPQWDDTRHLDVLFARRAPWSESSRHAGRPLHASFATARFDKDGRATMLGLNPRSIDEVYESEGDLGAGAFGAVSLCREREGARRLRAVKTIRKARVAEFRRDFDLLAALDHPHIARVFEFFEDTRNIYVVMEPLAGGPLNEVWARLILSRAIGYYSPGPARGATSAKDFTHIVSLTRMGFHVGDRVVLCDNPKYSSGLVAPGSEGIVLGFTEERVIVLFAERAWNMMPADLVLEQKARFAPGARETIRGEAKECDTVDGASEAWLATVMRHVLSALAYCHNRGVVHMDVKPANILLGGADWRTKPHAVLVDFGVSARQKKGLASMSGTMSYLPPEVCQGLWHVDPARDMWALGCVFFELLTGEHPFSDWKQFRRSLTAAAADASTIERLTKSEQRELVISAWKKEVISKEPAWFVLRGVRVSDDAVDFCKRLLAKDPNARLSAAEALEHPWLDAAARQVSPLPDFIQERFARAHERGKMQRAVQLMVASQLNVTPLTRVNVAFEQIDTNGNGELSVEELREALGSLGVEEGIVEQAIQAMDVDGSGAVSYTEFVAGILDFMNHWQCSRLENAFKKLDLDGDQALSVTELQELLAAVGVQPDEAKELIKEVDKNEDGHVDFDEFLLSVTGDNEE